MVQVKHSILEPKMSDLLLHPIAVFCHT